MRFIIFILTFFEFYQSIEYAIFLGDSLRKVYDLKLFNNVNNDNLFYSGPIENIQNILKINIINDRERKVTIKEGYYPLVCVIDDINIQYINLFPTTTIFIIDENYFKNRTNEYQNYIIFTINNEVFNYDIDEKKIDFSDVEIGKK